tara:strand:- start:1169 stop:1579 length:411 start_codon:yes stop_codon:yes gene_type:complete
LDAAFLDSVIKLAERTSDSLRGLEDCQREIVRTTTHCMDERKESERLTQARVDALITSKTENSGALERRLKTLEKQIKAVCALAPRQPKWLWCFRELVTLVEAKPLATMATLLGLALSAVVLAELGFNITDWIQPP